jgi:hypothetical protein
MEISPSLTAPTANRALVEAQQPGAPSVIRIKRKRDDALPESLLLQRSKRQATEHTYVFKRLDQERFPPTPAVKQEYDDSGIPKIRTTPKGEEKRDPFATGRAREQTSPLRTKQETSTKATSEPRRFHLSRALSISTAAKGKSDVATFVERRIRAQNGMATVEVGLAGQSEEQQEQRTFKRPTARAKTQRGTVMQEVPTSSARIDASMAQQMDQWSQETSNSEAMKITPTSTTSPEEDAMDIDNETDYVYDTYYRHRITEGDLPHKDGISFGHLVIDEDQEDLWETYLDDNESDDDKFDTDDEDSNGAVPLSFLSYPTKPRFTSTFTDYVPTAEDYYGADYPEDEVASDDEYDRDAYQFRGKNTDDLEEFDVHERYHSEHDEDDIARSDDEAEFDNKLFAARAWKRDFGKAAPTTPRSDMMSA